MSTLIFFLIVIFTEVTATAQQIVAISGNYVSGTWLLHLFNSGREHVTIRKIIKN